MTAPRYKPISESWLIGWKPRKYKGGNNMLQYNQINIVYQDDNNTIYNGSDDLMELFIVNYNGVIALHNQGRDTFEEVWVDVLKDALYNEDEERYSPFETIKDCFIEEAFYEGIAYHWSNYYNDFINI